MAGTQQIEYPSKAELTQLLDRAGHLTAAARQMGISSSGLRHHCGKVGIELPRPAWKRVLEIKKEEGLEDKVHALVKRKKSISVEAIADGLDVSPRRVKEALESLKAKGFRLPEERGEVQLQTVVPDKLNLHRSLLDGDDLTIGVVSDTHLCSNEEALPELHLAYDVFLERGVTEVLHAGDLVCGAGIFRTQSSEIKHHTFETQVAYAAREYPKRDGVTTRMISGNHDIEGDFGRIGADPVQAVANQREDIEYLGAYSAWVELPNGAWIHLLHGKGGMSYAYSYKAQKLVDGYSAGRKPAVLIPGHWHVRGLLEARGVSVLFPACFEWQSLFLKRLGLTPSVGFHLLHLKLADDGSVVSMTPEYFKFFEGRTVRG